MLGTSTRRLVTVLAMVTAATAAVIATAVSPAAAQTGGFDDVPAGAYYSDAVNELAEGGVLTSCDDDGDSFCPNDPIDRKTMAVWVVLVVDDGQHPPNSASGFDDVDCCLPARYSAFIKRMAELGVTQGCGDGINFCPNDPVTRAQMAVFLTRAFNLSDGPDPDFSDVPNGAWYERQVAALTASRITQGCGDGTTFCPSDDTSRAQMATFLYRAISETPQDLPTSEAAALDVVAAPSEYESLAYRSSPPAGDIDVSVNYCSRPGRYSDDDLARHVASLQQSVAEFFRRESSGAVRLRFVSGDIMEPASVDWDHETLDNVRSSTDHDCRLHHRETLVLIDLPPANTEIDGQSYKIVGFAGYNRSAAYVVTEKQHEVSDLNSQRYLDTVAHELGHSILNLCHTHQTAMNGGNCSGLSATIHGKRYGTKAFIEYHNEHVLDEVDVSIMSYKAPLSPQQLRSYDLLNSDFINCRQRYIGQFALSNLDGTPCRGAPITDPTYEEPGEVPEGRVPGVPSQVSSSARDGALLVTWEPPRDDGGLRLTGYEISYSYRTSASGIARLSLGSTSNHRYLIENLMNGVEYTVAVRALNSAGRSRIAVTSATPRSNAPLTSAPGSVTNLRTEPGSQSVTIRWDPPANDGGAPITAYHIVRARVAHLEAAERNNEDTAWEVRDWPANTRSITVFSDGPEDEHVFEITPRNAAGTGPARKITGSSAPSDKQIILEVGSAAANHRDCPASTACSRMKVTLGPGFGSNRVEVKCATENLPSSRRTFVDPHNHEVWEIYTTRSNPTNRCIYWTPDDEVYVIVDGIRSNTLRWPDWEPINTGPSTPEGPSATSRSVYLQVGANSSNHEACPASRTCHWMQATLSGFGFAPWEVKCATRGLSSNREGIIDPTNHEVWRIYSTDRNPTSGCMFWTRGNTVYVVVDGVRSNDLTWP